MLLSTSFSIAVICVASVIVAAEDDADCIRPPGSHHQRHEESECCGEQPFIFPKTKDEMHEIMHKCFEEAGIMKHGHHGHGHPPPPPPEGDHDNDSHPPPPPPSQPFNDTAWDCVDECLFKNLDLLNDDGDIESDEIKALVEKSFTGDWATVGSAAADKCLATAKSSVDETSKCKSGAHQVMKCFGREVFLNCPATQWIESDTCKAAKERLTKCPNVPAPMPHHKH